MSEKDVLEKAITGQRITITICSREHALDYRLHNVIVYEQETGDSLFDLESYRKIDLAADPARWLACLWAGLHEQQADKSWKAPFTLDELGALVDFSNAPAISIAMVKALTAWMPKPKKEDTSPNAPAPAQSDVPAANTDADLSNLSELTSASSGLTPAVVTVSAATNF